MDYALRENLVGAIKINVEELFKTMFGVNVVELSRHNNDFNDDDLISKVNLTHEETTITVRFGFPRETLSPFLERFYDPIMAHHESTVEDAVCEITNIVCSGLKTQLNEKGYNFKMDLPVVDNAYHRKDADEDHINIDFQLQNGEFTVEVDLNDKRATLGKEA
jgi:hypothetical protein